MTASKRILVVEDEPDLAELYALHLGDAGYAVEVSNDGTLGLELATAHAGGDFDLLLLDQMLPGVDGLEICRRVRSLERYVPVLFLTAKGSELDRVLGLELGADDYLTKPVSLPELVARVRAIFRLTASMGQRSKETDPADQLEVGELVIDPTRRSVKLAGDAVELTAREFDLLLFLAKSPGRVYSRDQLVEGVWGLGYEGYEHTVNSHINRLRKKLEVVHAAGLVETVWGVGYRFREVVS
jgi:DNA-binding response OmpR family regulator